MGGDWRKGLSSVARQPADATVGPNQIAAGPDHNLWFTEFMGNQIGQITTVGTSTEFPVPTPASGPGYIAKGVDGALWFTEDGAGKVARITVDGVVSETPIPTANSGPNGITSGPDGNLWFAETIGRVGRIVPLIGAGNLRSLPTSRSRRSSGKPCRSRQDRHFTS